MYVQYNIPREQNTFYYIDRFNKIEEVSVIMNEQDIIKKLSKEYNKKEELIKCMLEDTIKNDKKSMEEAEELIIKFFE